MQCRKLLIAKAICSFYIQKPIIMIEKDPLTYAIIGCAMKVHNKLGPGFQEAIYHRALFIELQRAGLVFASELSHPVFYDDIEIGRRRADFVVADEVVIEIKAVTELNDLHLVQTKNYTVIYRYPRGLLINLGGRSLQNKLIFNPKK